MNRIVIVTFHTAINYGAQLQLFGLYSTFTKLGADVYLLDEAKHQINEEYSLNMRNWPNDIIKKIVWLFTNLPFYLYRRYRFAKFSKMYKVISIRDLTDSDKLVFGSDQIWNLADMLFLGESLESYKKWSYAASIHSSELIESNSSLFLKYLSLFQAVSVREREMQLSLKRIGIENAYHHLDPSLLLNVSSDFKNIIPLNSTSNKAVYYGLQRLDQFLLEFRSRERNSERVEINSRHFDVLVRYHKEPSDLAAFIKIIGQAKIVYTTSFHGLATAILFKRNVIYTKVPHGSGRFKSLISILKLEVETIGENLFLIDFDIQDNDELDSRLLQLRSESLDYLKNIVDYK